MPYLLAPSRRIELPTPEPDLSSNLSLLVAVAPSAVYFLQASGTTYLFYGVSTTLDYRQTWLAAAQFCSSNAVNGTLSTSSDYNRVLAGLYMTGNSQFPSGWGSRKTCTWVGASNLQAPVSNLSAVTGFTPDLFWAEDSSSWCGAYCQTTASTGKGF